jgi:hypothetical protein
VRTALKATEEDPVKSKAIAAATGTVVGVDRDDR